MKEKTVAPTGGGARLAEKWASEGKSYLKNLPHDKYKATFFSIDTAESWVLAELAIICL